MHNCLQNFFLIFLFFTLSSSIYAMENNLNAALADYVTRAGNNLDLQKIKEYIEKGANPNCKTENGASLVCTAVLCSNNDLLKCLIEHNANVSSEDYPLFNPLKCAVDKDYENGLEIIGELCKAGAPLILRDFSPENKITIFHHLIRTKIAPKRIIKTIITHTCFYDQMADEQLKKQIITSLLVFNKLSESGFPNLPEIKFRILSHLVLDFSSGFNERFRKKLIEMNCKNFILPYVEKRVENIDKTLQVVDRNNMTPAQWWDLNRRISKNDTQYAAEVQSLLDGSKLRNDMIIFKNSFSKNIAEIPEDNLILKICNVQKLLEK